MKYTNDYRKAYRRQNNQLVELTLGVIGFLLMIGAIAAPFIVALIVG
jgi:hypothetical protein